MRRSEHEYSAWLASLGRMRSPSGQVIHTIHIVDERSSLDLVEVDVDWQGVPISEILEYTGPVNLITERPTEDGQWRGRKLNIRLEPGSLVFANGRRGGQRTVWHCPR